MNRDRVTLANETLGWLLDGEGEALNEWALKSPGPLVEIGSYCGKSLVWIADAAEQIGQTVISIDPHRGNPEMAPGNDCHHPEVWDTETQTIDSAPTLRRTLYRADLESTVAVLCCGAEQAAVWWSTPIGFLFIDGDHGPAAQRDYRMWSPHLLPGAVLAFHDTAVPPIADACRLAKRDGWVERLEIGDCLRIFSRP
jgi:predicted O-methyltransferase YrrM